MSTLFKLPRKPVSQLLRMVLVTVVLLSVAQRSMAQVLDGAIPTTAETSAFHDPFISASDYLIARKDLPKAVLRLTYDLGGTDELGEPASGTVILTLADDWAMVERDGTTTVLDFRLLRVLSIDSTAGSFRSDNLNAAIYFNVMERWNRSALEAGLRAAEIAPGSLSACDADTALGLKWPDPVVESVVTLTATGNGLAVTCDERPIGSVQLDQDAQAPAALWPTLARTLPLHPDLLAAVRERGKVPTAIQSDFLAFERPAHIVWSLVATDPTDVPFPLLATMRNVTADMIAPNLPEGLAALAFQAVSGTAASGSPQASVWLAHLADLVRSDPPAAALALIPTIHSFPALINDCASNPDGTVCQLLRDVPILIDAEPSLRHVFRVAFLDFDSPDASSVVLGAILATRFTDHANDPFLLGTWGIALASIDGSLRERVADSGLESDPAILILQALRAFPYDPECWFVLAKLRLDQWDFGTAFLLLDTAMSLPMPEAIQAHPDLQSIEFIMMRIRADFPNFYLDD